MSFIEVSPDSDFPLQNLPYGVFSTADNVSFLQSKSVEGESRGVSLRDQSKSRFMFSIQNTSHFLIALSVITKCYTVCRM